MRWQRKAFSCFKQAQMHLSLCRVCRVFSRKQLSYSPSIPSVLCCPAALYSKSRALLSSCSFWEYQVSERFILYFGSCPAWVNASLVGWGPKAPSFSPFLCRWCLSSSVCLPCGWRGCVDCTAHSSCLPTAAWSCPCPNPWHMATGIILLFQPLYSFCILTV